MKAAIVEISKDFILQLLHFEGGKIHAVMQEEDRYRPPTIRFIIEHPDMPEVKETERYQFITPNYQVFYGENGQVLKIERIKETP
jgi:hypothetical protein